MHAECRACYLFATCPARSSIAERYRDLVAAGATPWEAVERLAQERKTTPVEVYAEIERAAGKL